MTSDVPKTFKTFPWRMELIHSNWFDWLLIRFMLLVLNLRAVIRSNVGTNTDQESSGSVSKLDLMKSNLKHLQLFTGSNQFLAPRSYRKRTIALH